MPSFFRKLAEEFAAAAQSGTDRPIPSPQHIDAGNHYQQYQAASSFSNLYFPPPPPPPGGTGPGSHGPVYGQPGSHSPQNLLSSSPPVPPRATSTGPQNSLSPPPAIPPRPNSTGQSAAPTLPVFPPPPPRTAPPGIDLQATPGQSYQSYPVQDVRPFQSSVWDATETVSTPQTSQPNRFDMTSLHGAVDSMTNQTHGQALAAGRFSPPQTLASQYPHFAPPPPPSKGSMPSYLQSPQYQSSTHVHNNQGIASTEPSSYSTALVRQNQSVVSHQALPNFPNVNSPQSVQNRPSAQTSFSNRPTVSNEPAPNVLRVQRDDQSPRTRKILSLDGGGVRGLASLIILQHLMNRLEDERGGRIEPWQEFDMIAGTSTGGLIAIMLGRLRMSVDECIEAYTTLSREIFKPVHSKVNFVGRTVDMLKAEGRFLSQPLEEQVKRILQERGYQESELLKEEDLDAPKVFVCAIQGSNSDAVVIRSYKSKRYDSLYRICKIWEAARATSAASTFFEPIKIGTQRYVDGALRYNNPIEKVDQESRDLWPGEERIIVSVGTGSAPGPNVLGNAKELMQTLVKIVTDSENENNEFRSRNQDMIEANCLFRFNVLQGLANIRLEDWEAIEEISAHTETYLRHTDAARDFDKCAVNMKESGQRLGYIAGEELRTHRRVQELSQVYCEFCEECHKELGVPYNKQIFVCVECVVFICIDCQRSHDVSHARTMIRLDLIQWMPKHTGVEPTATCRHCAQDVKIRWECKGCDFALCRPCVSWDDRRKDFFKDHKEQHSAGRLFVATYPPGWKTNDRWITESCQCCDLPGYYSHCQRCHRPICVSQRVYYCRTCKIEYGGAQNICEDCYTRDTHNDRHDFLQTEVLYSESGPDHLESMQQFLGMLSMGCRFCPSLKIPFEREHLHEHLQLTITLNPLLLEIIRDQNYKDCISRANKTKSIAYPDPSTVKCNLCDTALAFEQLASVCLTKKCLFAFCASCTTAQRAGHRHRLYEVVLKKPPQIFSQVRCSYCSQVHIALQVQGMWCTDCNNHYLCGDCMVKVQQGNLEVPDGLPHQKILKPCKQKSSWIFYRLT